MEKVMQRKNEGFTLIELMIVVAIIGILAAVAVPQMSKYFNRANRAKIQSAIASINNEIGSWQADHPDKTLPITVANLLGTADTDTTVNTSNSSILGSGVTFNGSQLVAGNVKATLGVASSGGIEVTNWVMP